MRWMRCWFLLILGSCLVGFLPASDFEYYPNASYSPDIPTLEDVTGHKTGERISSYHEMEKYLQALAGASSRILVEPYGQTWEGRTLYLIIISSEENLTRLDSIRQGILQLAHVRISKAEEKRLIESLPTITWLAYGVHGNEISSPEAALLTAYHLAASRGDAVVDRILNESIVILDPLQNPDGRDRFVNYFRQTMGAWPDAEPDSAEHNEVWPGGRVSHYLFDMNRDWTAVTQRETKARIQAYLQWYPQVFADLHEMGGNSTYYFAPPAKPLNPVITKEQNELLEDFGRNNARWFDRMGYDYFTREVFDSFFPGYGESWPMFQGSIGMTYEQASVRGLALRRDDESTMHYRESVKHHFIASIATLDNAASNRKRLLEYFAGYRRNSRESGSFQGAAEFILPPGHDSNRTIKLVNLLLEQGIEVRQAAGRLENSQVKDEKGQTASREFPEGSFIVSMAQPSAKLAWTLLTRHTEMSKEFIEEQKRRRDKGLREQFYDVTGWSLPLYYGIPCYEAAAASSGDTRLLSSPLTPEGGVSGGPAKLAYLVKWNSNSSARLLAAALREGIRVHSAEKEFSIGGEDFPPGSLIIKVKNNPEDLFQRLNELGAKFGVPVYPTDSGWVDSGINFGSNNVTFVKQPKILMAYNMPTSSQSVGATRYILEQMYGYPVTLVHTMQLSRIDWTRFNVLILPETGYFGGGYSELLGERGLARIKDWIQSGGTLIAFGSATQWLTGEKVGLLPTKTEFKQKDKEKSKDRKPNAEASEKKPETAVKKETAPDRERPDSIPGALLAVELDTEHWLAFGYPERIHVLVNSSRIFTPLKRNKGNNVVRYVSEEEDLVVSGFVWEESRRQLTGKSYLMHRKMGRGNVIGFAENPNFRAYLDGLNLLFMNGILFGPSR